MKSGIAVLFILLTVMTAGADDRSVEEVIIPQRLQETERELIRAGIPPEDVTSTFQAMLRAGFNEEQMLRAGKQLAAVDGRTPVAVPVLAKIHEGIAKGFPPEAILAATVKVRNRYQLATSLAGELSPTMDDHITSTLADCLAAGLTEREARQLNTALRKATQSLDTSGTQNLAMQTLQTARTMARRNVSAPTTSDVLITALARGYDGDAMRTLRLAIENASDTDMEDTARRFGAAINRGTRAGELHKGFADGSGSRSGKGDGQTGSEGTGGSNGTSGNGNGGGSDGKGNGGGGSGGGNGGGGQGGRS